MNKNNSKALWSYLKGVIPKKNDESLDSNIDLEELNNFFIDEPKKIMNGVKNIPTRMHYLNYSGNFEINPIKEHEVYDLIKNLDTNKATGSDELSARMIKLCGQHITPNLCSLINRSIEFSYFPKIWKRAIIKPIQKKKQPVNQYSSYRPISILNQMGKLFERYIHSQLLNYLETINFFLKINMDSEEN